MTDAEKELMKDWKQKEQRLWRVWIYQENYRLQERYAIVNHQRSCNCFECRVYKQRVRVRCQRPIKRKPRNII